MGEGIIFVKKRQCGVNDVTNDAAVFAKNISQMTLLYLQRIFNHSVRNLFVVCDQRF